LYGVEGTVALPLPVPQLPPGQLLHPVSQLVPHELQLPQGLQPPQGEQQALLAT
jgi:hypothetical protein